MSATNQGTYGTTITTGLTLITNPTTITNTGTISNPGYYADGITAASGTLWTLENFGTVTGGTYGKGVSLPEGLVTNAASGLIEGSIGVYLGTGTLTDAGTIIGTGGVVVSFGLGAADALTLDPGAVLSGAVAGLVGGDSIDLAGVTVTSASFAAGSVTLFDHGVAVDHISLTGNFTGGEFGFYSDGQGGTDITLGASTLTGAYSAAISLTALQTTIGADAAVSVVNGGITASGARDFTLVNQGSIIDSGSFGNAVSLPNGVLTNAVTGVIAGLGGVNIVSGTLINAGTIGKTAHFGTSAYVGNGTIDNLGSGLISGPIGVGLDQGAVVNFGIIAGSAASFGVGVNVVLSGDVTNAAGAVIEGGIGVKLDAGTLINAGLIRSTAPSGAVAVQFGSFTDVLVIDPGSQIIGAVAGLIAGDTIDLARTSITGESFAGGVLTLSNAGGIVETLSLTGALNTSEFTLAADGLGGTDVTLGAETLTGTYTSGLVLTALDTTIAATARIAAARGTAVYGSAARNWTVVNDGAVSAAAGYGIDLADHGSIANNGTAIGSIGVYLGTGRIVNAGSIGGTAGYGVDQQEGVLQNLATGTITGISGALDFAGTILNAGLIAGTGATGFGALMVSGTLDNLAGGVIAGNYGAYMQGGTIINAGIIAGTSGVGMVLGTSANTIVIDPGSTIIGAIAGFGAGDVLDFATTSLNAARFANGYLTLAESGAVAATYGLVGNFTPGEFILAPDGRGGTEVTLGAATATGTYSGFTLTALYTSFAPSVVVANSSSVAAVFGSALHDWTVVNAGLLVDSGTGAGVKLAGSGTLINQAGGYVAGYNGAYVYRGAVANAGTIQGAFNGALDVFGTIDNAAGGIISGQFGAYVFSGTIINAGTIESSAGSTGTAAILGANNGAIIDDPGAVFIGAVVGAAGRTTTSLLELGAGASEGTLAGYGTQFSGFKTLEVAAGATWDIAGTTTITGTLINNGTIIETAADTLVIDGPIAGSGTIVFDPTTGVFNGPVGAGQVIDFNGANDTIVLGDPTQFAGTLSGFAPGDVLSLPSLAPGAITGETFANGTLTLTGSFGVIDLAFTNSPGLSASNLTPTANGQGGISFDAPCFAAGTGIATARGVVAVEDLRIGDLAALAGGGHAPIVWLGRRAVQPARHPRPACLNPVVIEADALADGVPCRDLTVSPDHALLLDGHLIPAKSLVNGDTIRQIAVAAITYYHVELPSHAALLAEGAPAESYFASGNRDQFENGGGAMRLHPDFAQVLRETQGCARFAAAGPVVEAVRTRLLARAALVLTDDAALRIEPHAGGAMIKSRHFIPAEQTSDPRDGRRLGVKIATLSIAGVAIPLDHPALIEGWHACEADGRWTDGGAIIPPALLGAHPAAHPAASIAITLATAARYRSAA